ncbi:MAG: hypothetical protein ABW277_19175 [Longimicrobiaceae bacterium]
MRHLAFSALAVLALTAACKDQPKQSPTEPAPEAAASVVEASTRVDEGESTLCAAYRQQLGEARAALARTSTDESLKDAVSTYQAVIADACP